MNDEDQRSVAIYFYYGIVISLQGCMPSTTCARALAVNFARKTINYIHSSIDHWDTSNGPMN